MTTAVVVHGVGLWPGSFSAVTERVAAETGCEVVTWTRPPYDGGETAFGAQLRALAAVVVEHRPAVVAGVSGGATLALALGIESAAGRLGPDVAGALRGIVTHEPLIGALEPVLGRRVADAATELAADPTASSAASFCRGLYGPRWSDLGADADAWFARHADVVPADVAAFSSFQPAEGDLAEVAVPHRTSVGARSGPERHRVAATLAAAGATSVVVPDCGHLIHLDAPDLFVRLITSSLTF